MKIKVLSQNEGDILISLLQQQGENVSPEVEVDAEGLLWVRTHAQAK